MAFDLSTAKPVSAFDLSTARPVEDTETIFRDDTKEVISAPKGVPSSEVLYIDDIKNRGQEDGGFFGFKKIGTPVDFAKGYIKGIIAGGAGVTSSLGGNEKRLEKIQKWQSGDRDFTFVDWLFEPGQPIWEKTATQNERWASEEVKLKEKIRNDKEFADALPKIFEGMGLGGEDSIAGDLGQGATSLAQTVGLTIATKNPALASAVMFRQQKTGDYREARDAGLDIDDASISSTISAGSVAIIEAIGTNALFKSFGQSGALKRAFGGFLTQATEEGAQELAQILVKNDYDVTNTGFTDAVGQIAYAGMIGGLLGAPVSVVMGSNIDDVSEQTKISKEDLQRIVELSEQAANSEQVSMVAKEELSQTIDEEFSPSKNGNKRIAETASAVQMFGERVDEGERQISTRPEDRIDPEAMDGASVGSSELSQGLTQEEEARYSEYVEEKQGILEAPKKLFKGIAKGFDQLTLPISERLRNIDEGLMFKVRRFEIGTKSKIQEDERAVVPFLEKMKTMSAQDAKILDIAMKNQDAAVVAKMAAKYDMTEELSVLRQSLNAAHNRALEAGIDVGYKEDFFPRLVIDPEGLLNYLEDQDYWNVIEEAIRSKENATGNALSIEERAEVANTLLRGFQAGEVSLAKAGAFKERAIQEITPEIDKFYAPTDQALIAYSVTSNEAIEAAKLFGKGDGNIEASVGAFVDNLVRENQINSEQAAEIKEMLGARFNRGRMTPGWEAFKNGAYLTTMGSNIGSSITQISDLAITAYKMGVFNTIRSTGAAARANTKVTLEDVGVQRIAQEFESKSITGKLVQNVFELTGLSKVDRFGKRTLLEASYNKNLKQARKNDAAFNEKISLMFGDGAAQVKRDLVDGNITEDVKFIMANDLLDLQPVALSEMPEQYLRSANGKIFYILKSFTLKQISIYRRDGLKMISEGATSGDAKKIAKGIKNITVLLSFMTIAGVGRDYIWDFLSGQEPDDLDDRVVENIYKAFGLNKYTFDQMNRPYLPDSPASVVFGTIIPPTKTTDNLWRDWQKLQSKKGLDFKDMRALRSVPVGGELYWFWFGGGSKSSKNKSKAKIRRGSSND